LSVDSPRGVQSPAAAPARARPTKRRRRPSGEPPPLPKNLRASGTFWVVMLLLVLAVLLVAIYITEAPFERFDTWISEWFASIRTGWLTNTAHGIAAI
jgi:hypothetical protein